LVTLFFNLGEHNKEKREGASIANAFNFPGMVKG
jgi:hypothetical protein